MYLIDFSIILIAASFTKKKKNNNNNNYNGVDKFYQNIIF